MQLKIYKQWFVSQFSKCSNIPKDYSEKPLYSIMPSDPEFVEHCEFC